MEFSITSKHALSLINKRRGSEFSYLKCLQAKSIRCAYENDAIIVLPTGYGKSLIFEIIPTMRSTKAVIVSPLNAILDEQSQILGNDAIIVDEKLIAGLKRGEQGGKCDLFRKAAFKYILGHPEHLLKKEVCDIMCRDNWLTANVSHLFIDEAHCVVNWGKDFRTDFCELSKLRAIFPYAHMVCLTATATVSMQNEIARILGLSNFQTVSSSIDRPNLKLSVVKRLPTGGHHTVSDSFTAVVKPYVDELCRDVDNAHRTIIYCKLKWCGYGYELSCREASRYKNEQDIIQAVSQFHAPCTSKVKQMVAEDMSSSSGKIKLLFATEAYGMGADSPNIDQIVHVGPPTSAETYIQEIGRGGRDGRPCQAVLHYNNSDLSNVNVREEMKNFCTTSKCRRQFICEHFGSACSKFDSTLRHNCCDICEKTCVCIDCSCSRDMSTCLNDFAYGYDNDYSEDTKEKMNTLRDVLRDYFNAENEANGTENANIITGLSESLIDKILLNHHFYISPEEIHNEYPYLRQEFVSNIFHIINQFN